MKYLKIQRSEVVGEELISWISAGMAQIEILLHLRKMRGCFEKESLVALAGVKDINISLPVGTATTILSSHQQPATCGGRERTGVGVLTKVLVLNS